MKKQVFIINGSGGVGKDTLIELIAECSGFSIMNFSSVDKVKEIARMIGWDGGKTEKDRKYIFSAMRISQRIASKQVLILLTITPILCF
jgi:replication-associated recombination protein RarA